jgi:ribA/ribD-fused uncharacterized protein
MKNEYAFLSNYYPCFVEYDGIKYKSSEAAFQAQKEENYEQRKLFKDLNPAEAKARGRKIRLRKDWEQVKDQIMYEIVKAKFEQSDGFIDLLLKIEEPIIEDNTWNDTYWGVCNGVGQNKLGLILERLKKEFNNRNN